MIIEEIEYHTKKGKHRKVHDFKEECHRLINDDKNVSKTSVIKKITKTFTNTSEWQWNNELSLSADATFQAGIPIIAEGQINVSAQNTICVGHTRRIERTKEESLELQFDVEVKPMKIMIFDFKIEKYEISVPFTATLRKGEEVWQETGTYKGMDFMNTSVVRKQTDIIKAGSAAKKQSDTKKAAIAKKSK